MKPKTQTQFEIEPLLSPKKVKLILGCSLAHVYKLAQQNRLAHVRWECPGVGIKKPRTKVRFRKSDVLDFIEKHYKK